MKWLILTSALFITSCASLNPLDMLSSKPSIEATANVGKNVDTEKNTIKVESGNQNADTITNTENTTASKIENVTNNVPIQYLLLTALMAGWAIPSPKETYKGVKQVLVDLMTGIYMVFGKEF